MKLRADFYLRKSAYKQFIAGNFGAFLCSFSHLIRSVPERTPRTHAERYALAFSLHFTFGFLQQITIVRLAGEKKDAGWLF